MVHCLMAMTNKVKEKQRDEEKDLHREETRFLLFAARLILELPVMPFWLRYHLIFFLFCIKYTVQKLCQYNKNSNDTNNIKV